jgi:P2-related tail formation protein
MGNGVIISERLQQERMWFAFDIWMQEAFARVPVDQLLLYFADTVNPAALVQLGQFTDVLGDKGWNTAVTVDAQRDLVKRAMSIKRYIGTRFAIEQVMDMAGFGAATLVERCGTGPTGWAVFRITVDISVMRPDPAACDQLMRLVMLYKNARSVYEGCVFTGYRFHDHVGTDDSNLIVTNGDLVTGISDSATTIGTFYCNGVYLCDGSRNFDNELDTLSIVTV